MITNKVFFDIEARREAESETLSGPAWRKADRTDRRASEALQASLNAQMGLHVGFIRERG